MKYVSTRGQMSPKSFTEILVMGLAPDGGLCVPETIPKLDEKNLLEWQNLSYQDLCFNIFSLFIDDISAKDLRQIIKNTYNKQAFGSDEITPVRKLSDKTYILETSNGPTLAFKDIAMQMIGELFEFVLVKNNRKLNIVGATSGDTGSAAEQAMIGKKNINVFMLSPHNRMSPFQQAQMFGINEPNIFNIAVKGVFDDCQDIVKEINSDADFKKEYSIGAVNSINWARILSQVVYYFKAYFELKNQGVSEPISFSVPSGNFGNVYAGFVAKQLGLPINKLIVATNENNVLDEFFKTYNYRARKSAEVLETSSPSMDIGKSSNFERYIYNILEGDADKIANLWQQLGEKGEFDLSDIKGKIKASGLISGESSHKNRLKTIKETYEHYNDLIDPHTADGVFVANELGLAGVTICIETALPAKFEKTIQEAVGFIPKRPAGYENIENVDKKVTIIDNLATQVKRIIELEA